MDNKTYISNLGELKVATELAQQNYSIFVNWGGKASCDLIAIKENEIIRVQVKSTTTRNKYGVWVVQLKTVRSNKTQNTIKNFDASTCDLLAIYIAPEDRVLLLPAQQYNGKSIASIKPRKDKPTAGDGTRLESGRGL